ncbi:hypothetical protein CSOJ01_07986 [Colletotrichum sojae]|uniref:Zn(2)-C6 fungal-type domain-containing protein n=1 Tax=Colletotrichum sojae TaxID=2175907 RepID=A0A8H6MSV2_9PEZI|nr:hypothetical protein CSOJ01_07986 [Colletotrichum sojae]
MSNGVTVPADQAETIQALVSTTTTVSSEQADQGANKQSRLRNSCDRCQDTKLKCSQTKPACRRCVRIGMPCVYSPIRRLGRPRKHSGNPSSASEDGAQQPQQQPQQQEQQQHQQQQKLPPPSLPAVPVWNVNMNDDNKGPAPSGDPITGRTRDGPSLRESPSPTFHHGMISPSPVDAFLDAMQGIAAGGQVQGDGLVAPSSLQRQSVIDVAALDVASFDIVMEALSATEQEPLFGISLAEASSFDDLQPWTWAAEQQTPPAGSPGAVQPGTPLFPGEDLLMTTAPAMTAQETGMVDPVLPEGLGGSSMTMMDAFSEMQTQPVPHTMHQKTNSMSTSSSTSPLLPSAALPSAAVPSAPSSCGNDCYRGLSQQLAGLNICINESVAPNVDAMLQIDRNMQSLTQRLLNCPSCMANDSSLLLLSIIVDQAVRLLERFVDKVEREPDGAEADRLQQQQPSRLGASVQRNILGEAKGGGPSWLGGRRQTSVSVGACADAGNSGTGSVYGTPTPTQQQQQQNQNQQVRSPIQTTDLRIGDYEVLDEEMKMAFLKRLVRYRLRILVRMLTNLQQTTGGELGLQGVQCSATHRMVSGIMERVERLRGRMSLKW